MRRRETDTEPTSHAADPEAPAAAPAPDGRETFEQIRGLATEVAELVAALGGLASAEASLSLTAFLRLLALRAIGIVLVALALVLAAVAATHLLAQVLGSTAAATGIIALGALLGAVLALWRARVWRKRIGFEQTRAALAAESAPPVERRP
jgi:uncharacterized membrane protein YqjE